MTVAANVSASVIGGGGNDILRVSGTESYYSWDSLDTATVDGGAGDDTITLGTGGYGGYVTQPRSPVARAWIPSLFMVMVLAPSTSAAAAKTTPSRCGAARPSRSTVTGVTR